MLVITILSVFASALALASVSLAKPNTVVWTDIEAGLEPSCTPVPPDTRCSPAEPDAGGEAEHRTKTYKGLLERGEFKVKVKVPVDSSSALGITDEDAEEAADIRLILGRDGLDYAVCFLHLDEIET